MGDMRTQIMDAASRLLREEGAQALTTRRVAEAAGTQAPTIYRLFGDKGGLLAAVAEHTMAAYVASKSTASSTEAESERDPVEDLRDGYRTHIAFSLANPELFALFLSAGRQASPSDIAGREVLRARVRRVAAAGMLRVPEERAVQLVSAAGNGALIVMLGTPEVDRDLELAEEMFGTVAAAILVPAEEQARPAANGAPLTAAVTLAAALPQLPALSDAERTLMHEWLARSIASLDS